MAKAEKYTADDTINEAGWGAAFGALKGYLTAFAMGAMLVVATAAVIAFTGGGGFEGIANAFSPSNFGATEALVEAGKAKAGGYLGVIGPIAIGVGLASSLTLGHFMAAGGALLGASDATRKANKSHARYMAQVQSQNQDLGQQAALVQAYNQGAQMGIQQGFQQGTEQGRAMGQQEVVQHLQQVHAQMGAEEPAPEKKFTHKHESKLAAGHTHKVEADKAMAAAAAVAGNGIA